VDPADREYYASEIEPMLDHPLVEFIGEISDREKNEFVGNALALVCPYDWPEPFGLVLIEALACGTPVLAYHRGSIPEIIEDGETGFVCESLPDMIEAAGSIKSIDRRRCRSAFEKRFTADRMARDYVALYQRILDGAAALAKRNPVGLGSRLWVNHSGMGNTRHPAPLFRMSGGRPRRS
jgi:glycosyltransferase involved in cell wall biosynthesis